MFRSAIARAAPSFRVASTPLLRPTVVAAARPVTLTLTRGYAASAGLSKDDISSRVLEVMKTFEKVDGGKLSPTAAFTSDLGLDSLDAVEVVMAIEEEFGIEIPDAEADEITTVQQAVDYISKTPEGEDAFPT